MKVYVDINSRRVEHVSAVEQFGSWHSEYVFNINGVSIDKDAFFVAGEIELINDVKPGDTVYVLTMCYSTGDSFGRSNGEGVLLAIFTDMLLAETAEKQVIEKCDEQEIFEFIMEDGSLRIVPNVVHGYFESLDSTKVAEYIVESRD